MQKYIILTLLICNFLLGEEADHIIFTRITITPDQAEVISIHNPTDGAINLSDYYLSDAEYSVTNRHYYNLSTGNDYWSGFSSDFIVRFPDIDINSGQTLMISLQDASTFNSYYSYDPDLTLTDDMLDAVDGENTIGASANLANNYEVLILFKWDGNSTSLIQDVDYFYWGDSQGLDLYGIDKTGISTYKDDTSFDIQENNILEAHDLDYSYVRKSTTEDGESGPSNEITGNGITEHDETSEIFNQSWEIILNPDIIYGCTDEAAYNYDVDATTDDGTCINITHTIEDIITGSTEGYDATVAALIVGFEDIRPSGGPQVIVLQDTNGYQVDAVVWDWDVAESEIGYMIDPYNPSEFIIGATGTVGTYNGLWQFDIAAETDIFLLNSYNPEGSFTEDTSIVSAKIETAPYVIIPSIGERLDFIYSFPSNSRVVIRIFDLSGRFITSIVDQYYQSGGIVERVEDNSEWDGTNHLGQIVDPGTYLIHIEAFNFQTGQTSVDVAPIVVGVHY